MLQKPEKKEQIVQAAAELVHVKGFNNTSVSDILEKADVGKGQFYHYFKSKEELGYAVIDYHFEGWNELILSWAFDADDIRGLARIQRLMDFLVQHFREAGSLGGCPFANLALEMGDIHEGFRARIQEVFEEIVSKLVGAIEEAKEDGEVAADSDSQVQARTILAMIEGGIMLMKAMKSVEYLEEVLSQVRKQFEVE